MMNGLIVFSYPAVLPMLNSPITTRNVLLDERA